MFILSHATKAEEILFRWLLLDRKCDTLSEIDAAGLYNIFKMLGFKSVMSVQNICWDTIINSRIEERFYPWLSTWLPRNYKVSQNVLSGRWENSDTGEIYTIKNCIDYYLEIVRAPKDPDLLETWWDECPACKVYGSDPHNHSHQMCKLNKDSDEIDKLLFKHMKNLRNKEYSIYYIIDEYGCKKDGEIRVSGNECKDLKLTDCFFEEDDIKTWDGKFCDNQTKISWENPKGKCLWYKIS